MSPFKLWFAGISLFVAYIAIPVFVNWLRHQPQNLERGTQHSVLLGTLGQFTLVASTILVLIYL